jgi:hypothetical protein
MKYKFCLLLVLPIFLIGTNVLSQEIKGRVIAESGFAAANVTVKFSNKANAISTNKDGTFKIMATKLPDTLIFSAVGYEPYKVVVTEKTVKDPDFSVVLLNKREELNEVVVTGYGRKSKKEMTYAAALVASDASAKTYRAEGKGSAGSSSSIKLRGISSMSTASYGYSSGEKSTMVAYPAYASASGKKFILTDSVTNKNGKTYATRLLTAGEVNDFGKWKMWEDFTDNDFKFYSTNWNLYFKQRYCIQLQTKNKYAAIGETVYLIDVTNNDTVWQAITDNTGKAELWADVQQKEKSKSVYEIAVNGYDRISKPYLFEEGINRMTINKDCNNNKTVEIAFVVDATGSMGDEIEYLKLELEDVLNKTFDQYADLNLRAASVFYRDHGDAYLTKHIDFNTDLLKVLNFIKLQKADGGGDMPEAVDYALETAIDSLNWTDDARTKIMFLILDAPPHQAAKERMYNLIRKAALKGIRIVPIVCSGADKNTEFMMRSIALATNGTYLFLTNESGVGGDHIKPTTDAFNVELLNNLMPRIIQQMIYVSNCYEQRQAEPPYKVQPNTLKITVGPNPTTGKVVITSTKAMKDVFVADFTGKILMRLNTNEKQTSWAINISNYPAGTYIIKYVTTDNEWGAERLVLIH